LQTVEKVADSALHLALGRAGGEPLKLVDIDGVVQLESQLVKECRCVRASLQVDQVDS
jgi:hypothetical protein